MFKFCEGDYVSSTEVAAGEYVGKDNILGNDYHKVYDAKTKLTLFIPVEDEYKIKKLPRKSTVKNYLKIFNQYQLLDCKDLNGSRYKYFKSKSECNNLKACLEVFHDLVVLQLKKLISPSERKLKSRIKERLVDELALILQEEADFVEGLMNLQGARNELQR
jgi:RNA polymerase-interacting CarD/CdnL/TRCF family regulator